MNQKEIATPLINMTAYNWLKEATLYNKKMELVDPQWIIKNADIVALIFTANKADKGEIMEKFGEIYENAKFANIPIEVINVPFDEKECDMVESYSKQANWFTLALNDPLIMIFKFMFGITCLPFIKIFTEKCEVISENGLLELEEYENNAVISWLTTNCTMKQHRVFANELSYYGDSWAYLSINKSKHRKNGDNKASRNDLEVE